MIVESYNAEQQTKQIRSDPLAAATAAEQSGTRQDHSSAGEP